MEEQSIEKPEKSTTLVFKPKYATSAHARPGGKIIMKSQERENAALQRTSRNYRSSSTNRSNNKNRNHRDSTLVQTLTSGEGRPLVTKPLRKNTIKIIPLGSFGEIGKALVVYEYEDTIVCIDCGVMFPEEEMLGIDLVIPDVRYLEENKDKIKAWFFTHGHEDHIGSVPFILKKFPNVPIYAANLTAGMIRLKLEETKSAKDHKINIIKAYDKIKVGPFAFEAIQMAHSIPDNLAYAITTDQGMIMHVADWKIDHTPLFGQKTDLSKLTELGHQGVDLLIAESTNAEVPGYTLSERVVADKIDKIFKKAEGRVIIAMFASNINRIQQVLNASDKARRKVAISGRSMEKNILMALDLGYLKAPKDLFVDIRRSGSVPDDQIVVLSTGAQGEEYSALSRMASGEHRQIKIKRGDTVVVSASVIPGNERPVRNTIDNLFKLGASVIYGRDIDVHVSGHAQQEEMKLLYSLLKPKYFIPMHGEYRMLQLNARLATLMGTPRENTIIIENGEVAEMEAKKVKKLDVKVQSGAVLVDGIGVGDVGQIVLRDRQAMAKEGVFVLILTVDKQNGKLLTSPDIISRGFIYMREREDLVHESRAEIRNIFDRHNSDYPFQWDVIKKMIRDDIGKFLYEKTQRQPMVIPVIIEV